MSSTTSGAGYKVISSGSQRRFEVTGGFQEGYGPSGCLHTMEDLLAAHHAWQAEAGKIMGLMIAPATVSYGWPGSDGAIQSGTEPGWVLSGEINVLYQADLSDEDALAQVTSLAGFIGDKLGQTRVYASFMGVSYVLERQGQDADAAVAALVADDAATA